MPKTSKPNTARKNISIDRAIVEQVQPHLYDEQTKRYRDFSCAVEEGLKLWLLRDAMTDELQTIIKTLGCVIGACNRENVEDASKHAEHLLGIVLGTHAFKIEYITPRSSPKLDAAVNLRDGLDPQEEKLS
jgi:hypothetical protein